MNLKRTIMIFLAVLSLLLAPAIGAPAAETPSVLVRTEALKKGPLPSTLTCYGVVNADTRRTVNIGFPRAGEVSRLMVSAGEVVKKGASLLEFQTAPGDALEYQKAQAALGYARGEVRRIETMVEKHLATNARLAAARKDLADAEALLRTQRKLGRSRGTERALAPFDGIVTALNVKEGDRTQAGTTLLQLARQGALRAELGVEPEDVHRVALGMPVSIASVFDAGQTAKGRVTEVHGVINPQTRLVDVLAEMTSGNLSHFLPGMQVLGTITLKTGTFWVVPRSAVLTDRQGAYIYQVDGGKARRVSVRIEGQTDRQTAIEGDFDPGLRVVTEGNYQLRDGMSVRESAQ